MYICILGCNWVGLHCYSSTGASFCSWSLYLCMCIDSMACLHPYLRSSLHFSSFFFTVTDATLVYVFDIVCFDTNALTHCHAIHCCILHLVCTFTDALEFCSSNSLILAASVAFNQCICIHQLLGHHCVHVPPEFAFGMFI